MDDEDLTSDDFLGGRITVLQPKTGYRAGIDPVLLAAAVPALAGQSVLELGCGAGVASLCLGARVAGLRQFGVELQESYADLARRNAHKNALGLDVATADLTALPDYLRAMSFDHVIANPPYFPPGGTPSSDQGREFAMREATPLSDWIDVAVRRLAPRGILTIIQDAARLPELFQALDARMGQIRVLPVAGRSGRSAHRIILRACKGSRARFQLLPTLILHQGHAHLGDHESYTPEISGVLRNGSALTID